MPLFTMIFSIVIILLSLISIISYRRIINPNSIVIWWWGGWYMISTLSITGIDKPSTYTGGLILIFLSGFTIGNLFFKPNLILTYINIDDNPKNTKIYLFYLKIIKYTYIPIFLLFAYYTGKAIYIMKTQGLLLYRLSTFSSERSGGVSVLYGNVYIDLFVNYFLISYLLVFILFGSVIAFYYKKYRLLIPSAILFLMYTIMQLGRFPFYFFVFFIFSSYLFINKGNSLKNLNYKRGVFPIMIIVAILFMIEPIRGGDLSIKSIVKLAYQPIIDYHTIGFILFDKEVTNTNSVINQHITFGMRSVGGISAIFEQFYHKLIDSTFSTVAFPESTTREFDTVIGYNDYGPITANAFYTCLYTLYMDGRELFIFLVPFILGVFTKINYVRWKKYNSLKNLTYVVVIMFALFFSIFQSQFEGTANWIGLLYIALFLHAATHCYTNEKKILQE